MTTPASAARLRPLAAFGVAIVATLAAIRVIRRIDANRFYGIIYGLTAIVGAKLLWDGLRGMIG